MMALSGIQCADTGTSRTGIGCIAHRSPIGSVNAESNEAMFGPVPRLVEFSGGKSLSGRLVGVEGGTLTLVVNGHVVAGTVRTPEATYRIRPAENGLHTVSQIDPSRLPPLGEPIPQEPPHSDGNPARR